MTTNKEKLAIVMPAYNEEDNILSVLEGWYSIVESVNEMIGNKESRLIVLNDGSKDSTFSIMTDFAETHPCFVPINKPNSGHGATLLAAYKTALDLGFDFVFQTDSDGQTNPNEFYQFWNLRNQYDMVIGERIRREDGLSRKIVTRVLKWVVKKKFLVDIPDVNTPFRLMSASSLAGNLKYVPADYNLSNVILSIAYFKNGYKVKYIPISFKPRQGGINSINMKSICHIGKQALEDFKQISDSFAD